MSDTKHPAPDVAALIRHYGLHPHPEGGYYAETYRSTGSIPASALPAAFAGERSYATAIVFLLEAGDMSCLHRIRQDEGWHFYLGDPLRLVMISPEGVFSEVRLGQDILNGEHVQYTVPAGYWFGSTPAHGSTYCLVGCTVSPGFDFADFEMGTTDQLSRLFPHLEEVIRDFTRPLS